MKEKIKEWLKRYIPAEIFATFGAILGSWLIFLITGNRILSAYTGTIGENTGYYGFIFINEHIKDFKDSKRKNMEQLDFLRQPKIFFLNLDFLNF